MWTILTYIYNSILILFIAAHLLVGAIISFLVGLYIGIYMCQNYEIPRLTEPSKLWEKFLIFLEQYRKKSTSSSTSNLSKLDILQKPQAQAVLSIIQADEDILIKTSSSPQSFPSPYGDDYNYENDDDGPIPTPTVILTEPEFEGTESGDEVVVGLGRRSSSQILEASLIINADNEQSYTTKFKDE